MCRHPGQPVACKRGRDEKQHDGVRSRGVEAGSAGGDLLGEHTEDKPRVNAGRMAPDPDAAPAEQDAPHQSLDEQCGGGNDASRYGDVGQIEYRPDAQIDEVHHAAPPEPVDCVAGDSAERSA